MYRNGKLLEIEDKDNLTKTKIHFSNEYGKQLLNISSRKVIHK